MSWPPPGQDPNLNEKLRRQTTEASRARGRILGLDRDRIALKEDLGRRVAAALPLEGLLPRSEALVAEAKGLDQPECAARAGMLTGEILLAMGAPAEALARWQLARESWGASAGPSGRGAPGRAIDVEFLACIARAYLALQDTSSLSATCGEAIALIELDRERVNGPFLQGAFLKDRGLLYNAGVVSAYQLGDHETMLARAELSKAQAVLRYGRRCTRGPDASRHAARFHVLCDEIRARDPRGSAAPDPPEAGRPTLAELIEERRRLWDLLAIGRARDVDDGVAPLPAFSLRTVQDALGPDEAILYYYWWRPDVLLVVAVDRASVLTERVVLDPKDGKALVKILDTIRTTRGVMIPTTQDWFDRTVRECSRWLLPARLRPAIEGKRHLLICPHRKLHLFPFHALSWRDGFLIEDFEVTHLPNISLLLLPGRRESSPKILACGIGAFHPRLGIRSKLAESEEEIRAAADAYREQGIEVVVLRDGDATRGRFSAWREDGTLSGFSCLILATHGESVLGKDVVDTPMDSRLYLFDAALDGLEISQFGLRADLVVLSACHSGQRALGGRDMAELPGDDAFGLTAAFAMAGARAVIGCLWPAHDGAASRIMASLHRSLARRLPVEVALRGAILDYLRSGADRHGFYWASFFLCLMGDRIRRPERTDRTCSN